MNDPQMLRDALFCPLCERAIPPPQRDALYLKARDRNPARWSGATRDWSHIAAVTLNPERDSVVTAHLRSIDTQPLAA